MSNNIISEHIQYELSYLQECVDPTTIINTLKKMTINYIDASLKNCIGHQAKDVILDLIDTIEDIHYVCHFFSAVRDEQETLSDGSASEIYDDTIHTIKDSLLGLLKESESMRSE
jgi:hypothetical protein